MLFFYVLILFILFIVQFAVSISCLALSHLQQVIFQIFSANIYGLLDSSPEKSLEQCSNDSPRRCYENSRLLRIRSHRIYEQMGWRWYKRKRAPSSGHFLKYFLIGQNPWMVCRPKYQSSAIWRPSKTWWIWILWNKGKIFTKISNKKIGKKFSEHKYGIFFLDWNKDWYGSGKAWRIFSVL